MRIISSSGSAAYVVITLAIILGLSTVMMAVVEGQELYFTIKQRTWQARCAVEHRRACPLRHCARDAAHCFAASRGML